MGSLSIWHWLIVLLLLVLSLLVPIFYILSFRKTAKAVNAAGGESAPVNSAWLLLVPLLGIPWFFVLLIKLKEAVRNTHLEISRMLWWTYGLAAGVLYLSCGVSGFAAPMLAVLAFVAWIVFAVLHWVELNALRVEIEKKRLR